MKTQLTRGAALALLLAGGSLMLAGCSETQALESELSAASSALVQHPVDLSGTWKVNADASDDPREVLGNRRGQGPRAGVRGDSTGKGVRRPGGRGGRGGPGGRFGEGPRGGSRGELTISQTDETVTLSHGSRRSMTITPDGQPVTQQGRGGERQVTAKWEGEVLVVEHSGPRGGTMTRFFELSADGQQLILTHKLEGGPAQEPMEFRVVFDKV